MFTNLFPKVWLFCVWIDSQRLFMSLWNCKVLLSFNSYSTSAPRLMVSGNCSVAGKASNLPHCIASHNEHTHKHTLKIGVDTYKAPPRKNTITSIDLELLDLHGYHSQVVWCNILVNIDFVRTQSLFPSLTMNMRPIEKVKGLKVKHEGCDGLKHSLGIKYF